MRLLHCLSIEWCDFTFQSFQSLTAGVLRFWRLHWRLALALLELVLFCYFVGIVHPGWHCSEVAGPFGVACNSFSMYRAESGDGALEMSEEASPITPITVAKRYRRQALQSGPDDFVGIVEQSGLDDSQLVSASDSASPSIPAAQSDSQVVSTPAPACTPLQILAGDVELTAGDHDEHRSESPAKPGSVSSQEFLSATEPFSVILGDEPVSIVHSLGQPSDISADPVPVAPTMKAGQASLSTTLVQTLSSMSCKRTAWDLGRSSSRAVSKARRGIPEYGVPPPKLHLLILTYLDQDLFHLREELMLHTPPYTVGHLNLVLW